MSTAEQNIGLPSTGPAAGAASQEVPPPENNSNSAPARNGEVPPTSEIGEEETEFYDPEDDACRDSDPSVDYDPSIEEPDDSWRSESPEPTEPDSNGSEPATPTPSGEADAQNSGPVVQVKLEFRPASPDTKRIVDPNDIPSIRSLAATKQIWLIEDFIVKHGIHIFSGQPGSMKSFLALFMARALSAGLEIYGLNATQTPVIYLDRENPIEVVQERYDLLHIEDDSNLHYWGMWANEQPPTLDPPKYSLVADRRKRLLDWAPKYQPVVFIDSLLGFHSREENSASEMRQVTDFLKQLRFAGATIIVLHHQGKAGLEGPRSPFRGSSEIEAACDIGHLVQKTEDGEDAILTVTSFKNRLGLPLKHRLRFDSKSGLFVPCDLQTVADPIQTLNEITAIAQFIAANPGTGVNEIRNATKIPERKVRDLLNQNPKGFWRADAGAHNKKYYFPVAANS